MKKVITIMSVMLLALTVVFAATACGGGKDGVAFAHAHSDHALKVVVTRKGDAVGNVVFDEVEGLASWGKKTNLTEAVQANYEFTAEGFAKTVKFANYTFKTVDGAATADPYKLDGTGDTFKTWLDKGDNAKIYFEAMTSGDYNILKADGTAGTLEFVAPASKATLDKKQRWLKTQSGYWAEGNDKLGWEKNMANMADYLMKNGFAEGYNNDADKKTKTGATLTDYAKYMNAAKAAFDAAK